MGCIIHKLSILQTYSLYNLCITQTPFSHSNLEKHLVKFLVVFQLVKFVENMQGFNECIRLQSESRVSHVYLLKNSSSNSHNSSCFSSFFVTSVDLISYQNCMIDILLVLAINCIVFICKQNVRIEKYTFLYNFFFNKYCFRGEWSYLVA